MTANEIRDSFKNFFESKGHVIVASAPMVIKDDPTLMFTKGMNQWKDIILGTKQPEPRCRADSQKCLRVSGKHNDLEEVGHDTYHHTMFEMLGNWALATISKRGAIDYAWEYLVDVLHLNPADLYVTVFEGSPWRGPATWRRGCILLEQNTCQQTISSTATSTTTFLGNGRHWTIRTLFWNSSWLSYTRRKKTPGRELVNMDDPQVIEIWNIVFMQFNRKADGSLEPLSMNVIDTGMGFWTSGPRSAGQTLQLWYRHFPANHPRDLPLIGTWIRQRRKKIDVAMRVISDHLRAVAFSIADGQLPSNAKAGYVIRRILRRAVRYAYTFLGQKEAFMYKLLPYLH